MRTGIGICTFGNLNFTKLAVRSIRETYTGKPEDLVISVIVGKPDDTATLEWCKEQRAEWIADRGDSVLQLDWLMHDHNKGFPSACNDMIDHAFSSGFGNLIIFGNDVIAYPRAIDALIECASTTDNEWICASQYDARSLYNEFREVRHLFRGSEMIFNDFDARPWDVKLPHVLAIQPGIYGNSMSDVQNCCLFKMSVFDKLGYFDVNFWPNGYFSDNDYCYRAVRAGVKGCRLPHAAYFHFTSRTMHQEPTRVAIHDACFERNSRFYQVKWGGLPDAEKFKLPFEGGMHPKLPPLSLGLKIPSRNHEEECVQFAARTA